MRVDDGCHGVGRIVEPVDEFEAERDQQSDAEQKEGQYAGDRGSRRRNVPGDVISDEEKPESHDGKENQDRLDPHRVIKLWPRTFRLRGRDIWRGNGRHRNASLACPRRLGAVDDGRVTKPRERKFRAKAIRSLAISVSRRDMLAAAPIRPSNTKRKLAPNFL